MIPYGSNRIFLDSMKRNLDSIIDQNKGFENREIVFFGYTAISLAAMEHLKIKGIMRLQLERYGYSLGKEIFIYFDHQKELEKNAVYPSPMLDVEEIKKRQFDILCFLKETAQSNNLKYYLMHGSLLGAVRHKGFIPWDDDIDTVMPVEDAFKLYDVLKNNDRYEFYVPGKSDYYIGETPMLMDKTTIMYLMKFPLLICQGVGIDVDLLFPTGNNDFENEEFIRIYNEQENQLRAAYMEEDYKTAVQNRAAYMLSKLTEHSIEEKEYVCGSYIYMEMIKKSCFGEGEDMLFEGRTFKGPKEYDIVLKEMYGDYMTPPPVEERNDTRHVTYAYRR